MGTMRLNVIFGIVCILAGYFADANVQVISRTEWGARAPKGITPQSLPVPKVFIHHTVMSPCDSLDTCERSMRQIQDFHMDDRGWWDIGYNFLIGGDGRAYQGRGWDAVGAQVKGYNAVSVGISFIGDFTNKLPTEKAMETARLLIQDGVSLGKIKEAYVLHGHRDANPHTACPGNTLYPKIQTWPNYSPNVNATSIH